MTILLSELARVLECELEGPAGSGEAVITGIGGLDEAGPEEISFLTDPRMAARAGQTRARALVAGHGATAERTPPLAWLRSRTPELAAAAAIELLRPPWRPPAGIHPTASIHPDAVLGVDCHVGAFVVIGAGCRIGEGAVLHPHVVIYPGVQAGARLLAHAHVVIREGTRLGDDVILQPGVVLGGDGFGFARRADGSYAKIPQVGGVDIEDGVEIQTNAGVDRATLATTRVGRGSKLDSLVQVGHNCELGENVLICAQTGLAGSTRVERGVILAGQVGVAGHCRIGAEAIVTAQSGTHGDLEGGHMYSGSPAFEHGQWLRATAAFTRLGEMQRELRALRAQVQRLAGACES